jgi:hypothetical protein
MPANRSFYAHFAAYRAKVITNEAFGKRVSHIFGLGLFATFPKARDSWPH